MKTITYSQSRANYAQTLDSVVNDREEVVVTRRGHKPVVIVSLADYESLKEAAQAGRIRTDRADGPVMDDIGSRSTEH